MTEELKRTAAEFEHLIRQIARIMNKRIRDSLDGTCITPPQFSALVHIYRENNQMTIGELCDRMFLACSTVSGLVDRLEKLDLVERYRDDEDRRVVRLRVTPKGLDSTESILEQRKEKIAQDLEMIAVDRQHELITNLKLLLEIMNDAESHGKMVY